jgi:hypothetical protein
MFDKNLQRVKISEDVVPCSECGNNIVELGHHKYSEQSENTPTQKDELCTCRVCGKEFLLHYEFFDEGGHINSFVFNGDINNPEYNWQDLLTEDQKKTIGEHLKDCAICSERLENEIISDAWLASLLHDKEIKNKTNL